MSNQANEGLFSPYLCRQRIKAARPFLQGKILDFGCGAGALAGYVPNDRYCGIDRDHLSIEAARSAYPKHQFNTALSSKEAEFNTIVSLAVIEHVPCPTDFLMMLKSYLAPNENARIVCTTPHPSVEWVHTVGAKIGLFSSAAHEEHETLLNQKVLKTAGEQAGLEMVRYRRFLFGANQIALYKHANK